MGAFHALYALEIFFIKHQFKSAILIFRGRDTFFVTFLRRPKNEKYCTKTIDFSVQTKSGRSGRVGSGRAGSFSNSSFFSQKKPLYHGVLSNLMSLFPEIWQLVKFGGFKNDHTMGHSAFWSWFYGKFRGSYCPAGFTLCSFIIEL